MSPEERQAAIDTISAEDLAKIQAKTEVVKVDVEDVLEAEFLMKFGFTAYWSLYPEKDPHEGITANEMIRLINASRKVDAFNQYAQAQTAFIGAAAAQSRKPSATFESATQSIKKNMRYEA